MSITLDKVELNKSVQVYKKNKDLTKKIIKDLFNHISNQKGKKGNYLINEIKQSKMSGDKETYYSLMSFKFQEEPSFLTDTDIREDKFTLMLLVEYEDFLFVLKKHVNSIENFLEDYIEYFDYEKFSHFKASNNPKYEKVSMGNMTISNAVIRSRSYEAYDLHATLPLASASRSVARSFRLNASGYKYGITPNTSRINETSTKIDIDHYIDWCIGIGHEISTNTTRSDFVENFSSPISLEKILLLGYEPIGILFHFETLEEEIDLGIIQVFEYDKTNSTYIRLSSRRLSGLLQIFRKVFKVRESDKKYEVYNSKFPVATFRANKKTFSFIDIIANNIFFEREGEKLKVKEFLNMYKPYTVVFNDPKYALIGHYAFADINLLSPSNIAKILAICETNHSLSNIESEKEKPHDSHITRFPPQSLFFQVEETFNDGILICDDMNDEWADHICIRDTEICFIHSKFTKKDSYGASALHDVVSQALKNIGRIHAKVDEYETKYTNKWQSKYESTQIERLRKPGSQTPPTFNEIKDALEKVYSNPNSLRKIYLATPFFEKTKLKTELNKFLTNSQTNVHYFQLIWLLTSFIGSCQDYGVQPYILCKQ